MFCADQGCWKFPDPSSPDLRGRANLTQKPLREFLTMKDEIKKVLHPIQFESVNHNSFRRIFFPHGLHHSVQRVLNGTLETKSRSSAKTENPLMIQRLMQYCEVSI